MVMTRQVKIGCQHLRCFVKTHPGMLRPSRVFVKTQVRPVKDSGLAPDGFPIQHTNSMKVGYIAKG